MKHLIVLAMFGAMLGLAAQARAAEYFVGPEGKPDAAGTREAPWDIYSTFAGGQAGIQPGDTIWILGGKYRNQRTYGQGPNIDLVISGTEEKPLIIRGAPGERAIIDGDLYVGNADYVWLWDLELTVTPDKPVEPVTTTSGSHPGDLGVPNGGMTVRGGKGQKFINLYIYENYGGGVGWWLGSKDGEMYGCIIVNNGWKGPDRNHGHCIYTQNDDGVKTIRHNIMKTRWGNGQYTMHAYGSANAWKNNFLIEENIAYSDGSFLVGGGRPSHGIRALNNYIEGQSARIGYSARDSKDCDVSGNYMVGGSLAIQFFNEVVAKNNTIINGALQFNQCGNVEQENNVILRELPAEPKVVLIPNEYDPNRAYIAIFNFTNAEAIDVKVTDVLAMGDAYRIMDPEKLFGDPVAEGVCGGDTISVPMKGPDGAPLRFAARVLFKAAK